MGRLCPSFVYLKCLLKTKTKTLQAFSYDSTHEEGGQGKPQLGIEVMSWLRELTKQYEEAKEMPTPLWNPAM